MYNSYSGYKAISFANFTKLALKSSENPILNNEHLFNIYLYDSVTNESFKSVES